MNITIKYSLSTAGQKASILAGGDGKDEQEARVGADAPEFAKVLDLAKIDSGGTATLDIRQSWVAEEESRIPGFDHIPTVAEILDAITANQVSRREKATAELARRVSEAEAVLAERRTRSHYGYMDGPGTYPTRHPDWAYDAPKSVTESPEAIAWVAELEAGNAASKIAATKERDEKAAKEAAEKAAKQARETARREKLGLQDGDIDLDFEDGALTECPVWEEHKRGKNWMAVITVDPAKPGGLDRTFASKAKGDSYYLLPRLAVGDAIEFGADYYSGSGRKSAERRYYYVVRVDAETADKAGCLILHRCSTGKEAVKEGAATVAI